MTLRALIDNPARRSATREARTVIQPWHPGDPTPIGIDRCAACPYDIRAHRDGRCPSEAEAIAWWGR